MLTKNFVASRFLELTPTAVPSILAYDLSQKVFVIGEHARRIAETPRPVVQGFKLYIAESEAMFDGRFTATRDALPQRRFDIRPEAQDKDRWISTKEATKLFLKELFEELPNVSSQLIIGIPATNNEDWLKSYRANLSKVLAELGRSDPQYFPEPFAVFQYYRHKEQLIPPSNEPLAVLVVDFGGGTLDSCIVQTTLQGNLARGGSTSVPLGVQSVPRAGKAIDQKLLDLAIRKLKDPRLKQETPEMRMAAKPWVILAAEQLKIQLAEQMQDCRLDQDCSSAVARASYGPGWYHPDVPVNLELTGEDLKRVIRELWFSQHQGFGKSLLATVNEAKFRGGKGAMLEKLDWVVLAGGSSSLPFVKELIERTLTGQIAIDPNHIVIGRNCDKAVAYGIAIEAAEERNRSLKTHSSMGPCIFNELYLYTAPRRREAAVKPHVEMISRHGSVEFSPGTLIPGLMQLGNYQAIYDIELPYRPHGTFIYWFTDRPEDPDPEASRFNVEQDIIWVPPKTGKKFRLQIDFDEERGLVTPTFIFPGQQLVGKPFVFGGLRLANDVHMFTGIDFGTSNSYAVALWAAPKEQISRYPEFSLAEPAGVRLQQIELALQQSRTAGLLSVERARELSNAELSDFIFHSIKIEGSTLSRGETDQILRGKTVVSSKAAKEPINVRDAYHFSIEHADYLVRGPGLLVRELNKIILRDIDAAGGTLRTCTVKLSGMDFQPPDPAELPSMMERFYDELKEGPGNKSIIQFAAEMHSKLTSIHPFIDGNGRTARLLMNSILINAGVPAVVINHSDKERYLNCLASTNKGDISDFCMLLAESVEATLDQLKRSPSNEQQAEPSTAESLSAKAETVQPLIETPPGNLAASSESHAEQPPSGTAADSSRSIVPSEGTKRIPVRKWIPPQELAELMQTRLSNLPVDRRARYEAWRAGFEALREEFRSICLGFNENYGHALYQAHFSRFDTLPFEKYEALLRNNSAPQTWFMALDLSSDRTTERFMFFFRHLSVAFQRAARHLKGSKRLPPTDVSLTISRRVAGPFQVLRDEPIRLREIAYCNGDWSFLMLTEQGLIDVTDYPLADTLNGFLKDAVAAFL